MNDDERLLERLIHVQLTAAASRWEIADALVEGDDAFAECAATLLGDLGWSYQTLKNMAWVAHVFGPERRHPGLSFTHHQEVASLPSGEADRLLEQAEADGLTTSELRRLVRDWKKRNSRPKSPSRYRDGDFGEVLH